MVQVADEWNADETRPKATQAWIFETAYFAFVGDHELTDAVAAVLKDSLRAVAIGKGTRG